MKRVGKKFGDTLIEVTIAIGIFSMVAVAVVSVVSSSTSGAQSSLETTVTREEIDAQAEALRFLQSAYANDTTSSNKYTAIWKAVTAKAINGNKDMSYTPASCAEPYSKLEENGAFVINYRALGTGTASQIVLRPTAKAGSGAVSFTETKTYPRLVYGDTLDLLNDNKLSKNTLQKAEGIFVIAVKDPGDTTIAEGGVTDEKSAYYDFYIRTCWYAAHDTTPSTISTVIRLYDPDVDEEGDWQRGKQSEYKFVFHDQSGANPTAYEQTIQTGTTEKLNPVRFTKPTEPGYTFTFKYWCTTQVTNNGVGNCNGTSYADQASYDVPLSLTSKTIHLYAKWEKKESPPFTLYYDNNGGNSGTVQQQQVLGGQTIDPLRSNSFKKTNHTWVGWCTKKVAVDATCTGTKYTPQGTWKYKTPNEGGSATLYAMWKKDPENKIVFNCGEGGTAKSSTSTSQTVYNNSTALKAYSTTCTLKANYTFNSWKSISPAATFGDGAVFNIYNSSNTNAITLTAQYTYTSPCTFNESHFQAGRTTEWTVPTGCTGTFQLEVWGAQGGTVRTNSTSNRIGGLAGYVNAKIRLNEGTKLYVTVGKQGSATTTGCSEPNEANGGFNGGGRGHGYAGACVSGGGGASHISGASGTLDNANVRNNIYIAAGGGGGVVGHVKTADNPDYLEIHGGSGNGGSQGEGAYQSLNGTKTFDYGGGGVSTNGLVGKGQNASGPANNAYYAGGGGGGWYGGSAMHGGGGGGSGYYRPNIGLTIIEQSGGHAISHTYQGHIPGDGDAVIRYLGN